MKIYILDIIKIRTFGFKLVVLFKKLFIFLFSVIKEIQIQAAIFHYIAHHFKNPYKTNHPSFPDQH